MKLPDKYLLSDLLKHRVRCDKGIDHGSGGLGWMHPPVHRLLGWSSKPSSLKLSRDVWRLNQLRGIGSQELFVKGLPSLSDQATLERVPTLVNSDILNDNGEGIGKIADLVFNPYNGQILYYLVARSDPRIPGTSRWRLTIDHITDQQPGVVSVDFISMDNIPLARSSIKQDILTKSREWRDQIDQIRNKATDKLEGWLDEPPWDEKEFIKNDNTDFSINDPLVEDWSEFKEKENSQDLSQTYLDDQFSSTSSNRFRDEEDPWI